MTCAAQAKAVGKVSEAPTLAGVKDPPKVRPFLAAGALTQQAPARAAVASLALGEVGTRPATIGRCTLCAPPCQCAPHPAPAFPAPPPRRCPS